MRSSAVGLLAILAVGCAATPSDPCAPETPTEHLTLRYPGGFDQVALVGDRIFSPNIEVARYDDAYRGFAFRKNVDLRISEELILGIVGVDRTELHIEKYPDGFSVRGLYSGHLAHLRVRGRWLEGQLGGRAFRLHNREGDSMVYESNAGPLDPSAPPTIAVQHVGAGPTQLVLPASFAAMSTERQAMLLALFLGR